MALHTFSRWRTVLLAAGLLVFAGFLGARAFWLEPDSLVVREYRLDLPEWPRALDGFRIAAVGDLHAGAPFVDERRLDEVVRRVTAANPDLVVWLGDYVIQGVLGGEFMAPEKVATILARARARYGQVAIIGNHDRWLDPDRVVAAFTAAGIPFLRWSELVLTVNDVRLHLSGLDDFELSPAYWPRLETATEGWRVTPQDEPILVLSHNPDVFPSIPDRVTLTLAAHTHGGQVRLPLIGSPIVPSSLGQKYARGHIAERGRHLFVNTGIGTSIIPVRFGVPPEISILTLRGSVSRGPDH